jgi:hypothetical protein
VLLTLLSRRVISRPHYIIGVQVETTNHFLEKTNSLFRYCIYFDKTMRVYRPGLKEEHPDHVAQTTSMDAAIELADSYNKLDNEWEKQFHE